MPKRSRSIRAFPLDARSIGNLALSSPERERQTMTTFSLLNTAMAGITFGGEHTSSDYETANYELCMTAALNAAAVNADRGALLV